MCSASTVASIEVVGHTVVYAHDILANQLILLPPGQNTYFVNVTFVESNVRALASTGHVEFDACHFRAPTRYPFVVLNGPRSIHVVGNRVELMLPRGINSSPPDASVPRYNDFGFDVRDIDPAGEVTFVRNEAVWVELAS